MFTLQAVALGVLAVSMLGSFALRVRTEVQKYRAARRNDRLRKQSDSFCQGWKVGYKAAKEGKDSIELPREMYA